MIDCRMCEGKSYFQHATPDAFITAYSCVSNTAWQLEIRRHFKKVTQLTSLTMQIENVISGSLQIRLNKSKPMCAIKHTDGGLLN